MITRRENLLRVLRAEKPEWVPVTGHCDPYNQPSKRGMDPGLAAKLANVQWGDQSTIDFSRYLGLDITDLYGPPIQGRPKKVVIESDRQGNILTRTWRTSAGDLRQVQRYSPGTNLWYTQEHMVKDAADLPRLAEVFADTEFELTADGLAAVKQRQELIGDDGIIMLPISGTPLGQMIRVHSGVEAISYLWADARKELHDLFGVMEDNHLRYLRLAVQTAGDVIIGMDDTSTTTQSPAMFEELCVDYTNRMAAAAHAAGKFYFHHSCGLIRDLLPLYRRTKMDAVHAFQIPPIGDVTIADGRKTLGDDITIFASFVQMCGDMSDRVALADSIRVMFEQGRPGTRFILGLAADPEKTMEETQFVVDECRKHQHGTT